MIKGLIRTFIKDYQNTEDRTVRERYCVLAGVLGVICNIVLFIIKLTIGTLMNSIAVFSDAFNNLSDMGSSLIAIIGAKMSNRRPDKEHPFGHGRMEYISSLIVSFIIILVGFELFKTSVGNILDPEPVQFSLLLTIVLALSLLIKLWMFCYNRYMGRQIHSSVLRAASSDSINDVVATAVVIISAVIGNFVDFPVDGVMGLAVSVLIVVNGIGIAKDVVGLLLGNPPDPLLVREMNRMILESDGIVGIHDLMVHDYGPGRIFASVHAEVPDDADIVYILEVIDEAEQRVNHALGLTLVIHMDPISVNCRRTNQLKTMVEDIVRTVDPAFTIHDFRITDGENRINLIFDLVVPCDMSAERRKEAVDQITVRLKEKDSRYCCVIQVDSGF